MLYKGLSLKKTHNLVLIMKKLLLILFIYLTSCTKEELKTSPAPYFNSTNKVVEVVVIPENLKQSPAIVTNGVSYQIQKLHYSTSETQL